MRWSPKMGVENNVFFCSWRELRQPSLNSLVLYTKIGPIGGCKNMSKNMLEKISEIRKKVLVIYRQSSVKIPLSKTSSNPYFMFFLIGQVYSLSECDQV